jgi:hypothetical protein
MTAYRPEDIPLLLDDPAIGQGRALEAGGMMLQREHFNAGVDAGEVFKGLPDDACQSPHWGYVISGNLKVRTTAGEVEEHPAGTLYYLAPGHVPFFDEATDLVEFSPAEDYAHTMEHAGKRMEELAAAASPG